MSKVNLKCIVVDDEPLAIEKMLGFISKVPYLNLLRSFNSGIECLNYLKTSSEEADILFLDIQMDDLTGIQLLELLKKKPYVIITSAYSEYALKGYELEVYDYLLKPYSFERFLQTVNRIYDKECGEAVHEKVVTEHVNPERKDYIFVKTEYRIQKVKLSDIYYIEGMKDYLRIVCENERIMTLSNFQNMLELLPDDQFFRIHKSYIINIANVQSIERGQVIVLNERLTIGESYKSDFWNWLEEKKLMNKKWEKK